MAYDLKRIKQNDFTPRNPHKIINKNQLKSKSTWEFFMFTKLDTNPNVVKWGYEVVFVDYIKPTDYKTHRYEVDIFCKEVVNGVESNFLMEVKPEKFTKYPELPKRKTAKSIANFKAHWQEVSINIAKFNAAKKYAEDRNATFIVVCYNKDTKKYFQFIWQYTNVMECPI